MLSIEKSSDSNTESRYNFNKPFDCIKLKFQNASDVLPSINWKVPAIVWLDYTCELNDDVLSDYQTFLTNASSGSIIIITTALSYSFTDQDPLDEFNKRVGENNRPREISKVDFTGPNLPKTYTKTFNKVCEKTVVDRNFGSASTSFYFNQLYNFKYQDGKAMHTFGGIIIDKKKHQEEIKKAAFSQLSFINSASTPFNIDIPNITIKEIKFLEQLMPDLVDDDGSIKRSANIKDDPKIPNADIKKFKGLYQYFPSFAETSFG